MSRELDRVLARLIAVQRVRFVRGYNWLGVFGIAFLVASQLQEHLVQYYQFHISIKVLVVLMAVVMWLVGLFDEKSGMLNEEQKHMYKNNDEWNDRDKQEEPE